MKLTLCGMGGKAKSLFVREPTLVTIWTPELARIAAQATERWETDLRETGAVYMAHVEGVCVGMTGWYRQSETEVGLRWTGVLPEYRRLGYCRAMLNLVRTYLPPGTQYVYEVTRNEESMRAFLACGFTVVLDDVQRRAAIAAAEYGAADTGWVLRLDLGVV